MPKPCIECKHYSQPGISPVAYCKHHEAVTGTDHVTGEIDYATCTKMRSDYKCGVTGALFEESKRNGFFTKLKYWFLD